MPCRLSSLSVIAAQLFAALVETSSSFTLPSLPAPAPKTKESAIAHYSAGQKQNSFNDCKKLFPDQRPLSLQMFDPAWKPRALCSDAFAVLYSGLSKTPLVVVEKLNRAQLADAKDEKRTDNFFADPRLPTKERAYLDDYRRSGWSRGHMAAAANAPTPRGMAQTFALSNMVPQDSKQNSGVWSRIESDTRKYAQRAKGDVFVFTGPIFDKGYGTIGRNRVYVPTRLYKLVYDPSAKRAWAHVLPNHASAKKTEPVNYAAFVKATGLNLLPNARLKH